MAKLPDSKMRIQRLTYLANRVSHFLYQSPHAQGLGSALQRCPAICNDSTGQQGFPARKLNTPQYSYLVDARAEHCLRLDFSTSLCSAVFVYGAKSKMLQCQPLTALARQNPTFGSKNIGLFVCLAKPRLRELPYRRYHGQPSETRQTGHEVRGFIESSW